MIDLLQTAALLLPSITSIGLARLVTRQDRRIDALVRVYARTTAFAADRAQLDAAVAGICDRAKPQTIGGTSNSEADAGVAGAAWKDAIDATSTAKRP